MLANVMGFRYSSLWLLLVLATSGTFSSVPTGLDLKLMKEVTTNLSTNDAISPFVMSTLMSQVWLATNGSTRDEITPVLGVTQPAPDSFLSAYQSAISYINAGSGHLTVSTFNRMYIRTGFRVRPAFANDLKTYYNAEPEAFSSPSEAADKINGDVAAATNSRITDLVTVQQLRFAELALVSAMYFKGTWKNTFYPAVTEPFLTQDGEKQVNMMKLNATELLYKDMGTYDVVALPYTDEDYCMLLIRPVERSMAAVAALKNSLDMLDINDIFQDMTMEPVYVSMPRFNVTSNYMLNDAMKQLGIQRIFSNADFSPLTPDYSSLFVSSIIHKVFVEVNENGTEAAGAGAVIVTRGAPPPNFAADRPFFAVVYNKRHNINMFTVYMGDPTET